MTEDGTSDGAHWAWTIQEVYSEYPKATGLGRSWSMLNVFLKISGCSGSLCKKLSKVGGIVSVMRGID